MQRARRRGSGVVLALACGVAWAAGCPQGGQQPQQAAPPPGPPQVGSAEPPSPDQPPIVAAEVEAPAQPEEGPSEQPPTASAGDTSPGPPARTPDPWDTDEEEPAPAAAPEEPEPQPHALWEATADPKAITRFEGIRVFVTERRLEVRGRICLKSCPTLEFAACTAKGKTHESLLLLECDPQQLHMALILLGLVATPQITEQGEMKALDKGDKVVVEVSWDAAATPAEDTTAPPPVDGRVRRRLEDLIYDRRRRDAMVRAGWVFVGSVNVQVPKPPDWTETHEVYAAGYYGNVIATYHEPTVVLDTPLIEGGDDTIYVPHSDRVPERGTEVLVHFRPWRDGDGLETSAGGGSGDGGQPSDGDGPGEDPRGE